MIESTDELPPLIMVLDRTVKDFEGCAFQLRRHLADELDRAFAAWAVASERGRFIVYCRIEGFSLEQALTYADEEAHLVYLLEARRYEARSISEAGIDMLFNVAPDIFADMQRRFG